jgi:hypothetical protein
MRKRIAFLGAAAAAVLAVAGVAGVAAQTGGSSSGPVGSFVQRLAANLGIGEDELQAAIDKTHDEMIDEAVAAGRISPELGETLKGHGGAEGIGPFGGFGFHFRGDAERGAAPFSHDDLMGPEGPLAKALGPVAEAAGTDVQTLLEGLKSGKSPEQVAGEHGVSPEEFKRRLSEAFRGRFEEWMGKPLPFEFKFEWSSPSSSGTNSFSGPRT